MKDIILGILGAAAAVFGIILLIKMLMFRKRGITTVGEVISADCDNRNRYYHTIKYTLNDKEYSVKDKAGYSNAFERGSKKVIVCESGNPENFRYTEELTANLIASVCYIIVGIGFVLKFVVF